VTDPRPVPLHRRSVVIEAFETEHDGAPALLMQGRLTDERPGADAVAVVHDMHLDLTVRLADAVIVVADARMAAFPHAECPFIAPAFSGLVGLSVARGYAAALRTAFGGVSGCAHLYELARAMGAAVMQGRASYGAARRAAGAGVVLTPDALRALRGTCHVWAPDGVGEQKVAAGWLPDPERYPAPALAELTSTDRGE
jgi:hypothetical protein